MTFFFAILQFILLHRDATPLFIDTWSENDANSCNFTLRDCAPGRVSRESSACFVRFFFLIQDFYSNKKRHADDPCESHKKENDQKWVTKKKGGKRSGACLSFLLKREAIEPKV
ncbi:hypothetical protein BC940DRAFT_51688 [Gongronella butleri]|nr:hypothetical protein BC940DRAFT_51688 [Gongronella butleri]